MTDSAPQVTIVTPQGAERPEGGKADATGLAPPPQSSQTMYAGVARRVKAFTNMPEHPFIPVPKVAELVLHYSAFGYPFSNTFNFLKETEWAPEDVVSLAGAVSDAWEEALASGFSSQCYLVAAQVYALLSETAPAFRQDYVPPLQGTRSSSTILPLNVAMTIQRRAAGRGGSRRGRVFHFGLTLADTINSAQFLASSASGMAAAYASFSQALETSETVKEVIVSRKQGNVWLAEGVTYEIVGWQGTQRVATKRKRIPKALAI